jgi:hypothetical protein
MAGLVHRTCRDDGMLGAFLRSETERSGERIGNCCIKRAGWCWPWSSPVGIHNLAGGSAPTLGRLERSGVLRLPSDSQPGLGQYVGVVSTQGYSPTSERGVFARVGWFRDRGQGPMAGYRGGMVRIINIGPRMTVANSTTRTILLLGAGVTGPAQLVCEHVVGPRRAAMHPHQGHESAEHQVGRHNDHYVECPRSALMWVIVSNDFGICG